MKKFKDIRPEWNDERMDIIGQNGNDGLHYEEVAEAKVPFDPPYKKVKSSVTVDKSGAKHGPMSKAKHLAQLAMRQASQKKEAYTGGPHDANWVNKSEKLERARDRAKRMGDHKKHAELDAQIKQHYKRGPGVREDKYKHDDGPGVDPYRYDDGPGVTPKKKKTVKELSNKTLNSYQKKATDQAGDNALSHPTDKKAQNILRKRFAGLKKANKRLGEGTDLNEELMFKVKIEGLPAMIMTGKSPADIKAGLRKILKKQDTIKDIPVERLSKAEVKKRYRDLAGEKIDEANDPASKDEGSMAMKQLEFIEYAADELKEHIKKGGDFPEWFQNKLSKAHRDMESLHSAMGEHGEEEDEDEKENTNESNVYFGTYNKHGDRDKPAGKSRSQIFRDARKKADERIAKAKASGKINPIKPGSKMKVYDADGNLIGHKTVGPKEAASCGSKRKVNELSKNTLGSYIGKATDSKKRWRDVKKDFKAKGWKTGGLPNQKIAQRNTGIKKAATKLAKKR